MTTKIKPIEKIHRIQRDNGQKYFSRSDKISEGEKVNPLILIVCVVCAKPPTANNTINSPLSKYVFIAP